MQRPWGSLRVVQASGGLEEPNVLHAVPVSDLSKQHQPDRLGCDMLPRCVAERGGQHQGGSQGAATVPTGEGEGGHAGCGGDRGSHAHQGGQQAPRKRLYPWKQQWVQLGLIGSCPGPAITEFSPYAMVMPCLASLLYSWWSPARQATRCSATLRSMPALGLRSAKRMCCTCAASHSSWTQPWQATT